MGKRLIKKPFVKRKAWKEDEYLQESS